MMDIFQRAGVTLTSKTASKLPIWSQVRQVVGDYPHVLNLSTCPSFRNTVPPLAITYDRIVREDFLDDF
jgi:hypothetical protein